MGTFKTLVESLPDLDISLENFGRSGRCVRKLGGSDVFRAIQAYRPRLEGWDHLGRKRIALLFKSDETVEFLVAAFAAISHGYTVVPLYPNWDEPTQQLYLRRYDLRAVAVGDGFLDRVKSWDAHVDLVVNVSLEDDKIPPIDAERAARRDIFAVDLPPDHPVAWIFTSGTSGELAKCTEISLENMEAAIENIRALDFLRAGMCIHSPLSASHIFAFVVVMGFLAVKPRRMLFSDVQHLARMPQERTGKVDAIILVPIVLNRMRGGFYEKLCTDFSGKKVPPELAKLARIPLRLRRGLKRVLRRAEEGVIALEQGRVRGRLALPWILLARRLFGKMFRQRLGSPDFVVIGGAKPNLHAMAMLEVMGVTVLQGWGMTETTGPLAVCSPKDRRRGAFGTCGELFPNARAVIEGEEIIVEGPQIARGYVEPDGTVVPFHGRKHTGDRGGFDVRRRLLVLGKVSDRITTDNGLNYLPVPMEDDLKASDLNRRNVLEEAVVIGDARARLGCVFFLREGVEKTDDVEGYLSTLIRDHNGTRSVDEQIGPWTVSPDGLKEAGGLGPSGKLVRRRIEEGFAAIYGEVLA